MNALLSLSFKDSQAFQKRWASLEADKDDLDYRVSLFAFELRDKFEKTSAGNQVFMQWCQHNLMDVGPTTANELRVRAEIFGRVSPANAQEWKKLGGWKQAKLLRDLPSNVQKQAVANARASESPVKKSLQKMKILPEKSTATYKIDVVTLAKYLNKTYTEHPIQIRNIIQKYL